MIFLWKMVTFHFASCVYRLPLPAAAPIAICPWAQPSGPRGHAPLRLPTSAGCDWPGCLAAKPRQPVDFRMLNGKIGKKWRKNSSFRGRCQQKIGDENDESTTGGYFSVESSKQRHDGLVWHDAWWTWWLMGQWSTTIKNGNRIRNNRKSCPPKANQCKRLNVGMHLGPKKWFDWLGSSDQLFQTWHQHKLVETSQKCIRISHVPMNG